MSTPAIPAIPNLGVKPALDLEDVEVPQKQCFPLPMDPPAPTKPPESFRSDSDAWVGAGVSGVPVNTSDGIDDAELDTIGQIFAKNPRDGGLRLYEDSANGTPVIYSREFSDARAKVTVDVSVKDGEITVSGLVEPTAELFKSSDLAAVMQYVEMPEELPTLKAELKGSLSSDGSRISDIFLSARIAGLPAISTDKLVGRAEAIEEAEQIAAIEDKSARMEESRYFADDMFEYADRFLPKNLLSLIDDAPASLLTFKQADDALEIELNLGGNSDFTAIGKNFLAGEKRDADEIDINALAIGHVDGDDVQLVTAGVEAGGNLSVQLPTSPDEGPEFFVGELPANRGQLEEVTMLVALMIGWMQGDSLRY